MAVLGRPDTFVDTMNISKGSREVESSVRPETGNIDPLHSMY